MGAERVEAMELFICLSRPVSRLFPSFPSLCLPADKMWKNFHEMEGEGVTSVQRLIELRSPLRRGREKERGRRRVMHFNMLLKGRQLASLPTSSNPLLLAFPLIVCWKERERLKRHEGRDFDKA